MGYCIIFFKYNGGDVALTEDMTMAQSGKRFKQAPKANTVAVVIGTSIALIIAGKL